jgi:hypothetical protein
MTPKEKAEELLDKMKFNCRECDNDFKAKQCSLIAVNEILLIQQGYAGNRDEFKTYLDYWQQVKQEIEKL